MGDDKSSFLDKYKPETLLAVGLGLVFILLILILAVAIPNPTQFQLLTFRIVLSLAAAGIGAALPGALNIKLPINGINALRATGAVAFFVIVYFLNPPDLIPPPVTTTPTPTVENSISVTLNPTETPTSNQPSTPTNSPTCTPTAGLSPTVTPAPAAKYCLLADRWYSSKYAPIDQKNNLWKLDQWGVVEKSENNDSGIVINRSTDTQDVYGVFLPAYSYFQNHKLRISLSVTIHELISTADCGGDTNNGACAVNLFMGIGNPINTTDTETENGRYIIFRDLDGTDGWICKTESLFGKPGICLSPDKDNPGNMVGFQREHPYQIEFDLDTTYNVNTLKAYLIDGGIEYPYFDERINYSYGFNFWIGYGFRSSGSINAFISCPEIQ